MAKAAGGVEGLGNRPPEAPSHVRNTFCITRPLPDLVLHHGDRGFSEEVSRFYSKAESIATEKLIRLKITLRGAAADDYWTTATEGLADLMGAQYAFVSKRMILDDEDVAVEMPPYGEPGSCLIGQAIFYDDGRGTRQNTKQTKYMAYGSPCAHMKHDKVLLIPDQLQEVITNNPNELGDPPDAYLAVPLTARQWKTDPEKCFGHFGVMWTKEGRERLELSFPFLEMVLHSLEDLMVTGFLERGMFSRSNKAGPIPRPVIIPHEAVTAAQSLKPYARSLSHELRTPMQGVVGMLDLMYATVREAAEGQKDSRTRKVFESLMENIEIVQDSSRRAVEAADNVVHAYDMNMGVPDTPVMASDDEELHQSSTSIPSPEKTPAISNNSLTSPERGHKRPRPSDEVRDKPRKVLRTGRLSISDSLIDGTMRPNLRAIDETREPLTRDITSSPRRVPEVPAMLPWTEHTIAPGCRQTDLRNVLQHLVNDVLRVGGRPQSAVAVAIEGGEQIEVHQKNSSGEEKSKMVRWSVEPGVPETILVEERELVGLISRVLHNAFKFTEEGSIDITARLGPKLRYIILNVKDTGTGIDPTFMPHLFKPFAKEDDSITRQSEGLGLGLMVAKGLARKINGDLYAVRSETSGPNRGSEFEMRIPLTPGEVISRPVTPYGSRSPSSISRRSADADRSRSVDVAGHSAKMLGSPLQHERITTRNRERKASNNRNMMEGLMAHSTASPQQSSRNCSTKSPEGSQRPSVPRIPSPQPLSEVLNVRTQPKRASKRSSPSREFDRSLATKYPLNFLVVEDNVINRKLLINMLRTLGYTNVLESHDGADAVRKMEQHNRSFEAGEVSHKIDVVLMDLWMPTMNGYEAAERILAMKSRKPVILAVTADVTHDALENVAKAGMKGPLTKPYKLLDLEKSILEYAVIPAQAVLIGHDRLA